MIRLLPMVLLLACDPDEVAPSTQVGNPGRITTTIGTADGTFDAATADVESWTLQGCSSSTTLVGETPGFNFLDPPDIELPVGEACGTTMRFSGPLLIAGILDGTPIRIELEPNNVQIKLATPLETSEQSVVLELGGPDWVTADDLRFGREADDGVLVLGNQGGLRGRLQSRSRLYVDSNGDGVLTDDERLQEE